MTTERAYQLPVDTGEWEPAVDLADEEPEEKNPYAESSRDYDGITVWKTKPREEVLDGERTKQALLRQHHDDRFGEDDPRSDEEMWAAYQREVGGGA